ncbi:MAG: aldehyde dehydrogenase family protein [Candidatus Sumerlaeaceae bacterium]|nr:aldehyde dehydrogenase family protein [Candidatus Sumerlaeaceae bacterium]
MADKPRYPDLGRLLIGGEWVATSVQRDILSPWDGTLAGRVQVGGAAEIDAAILSAVAAFETTRLLPRHQRSTICRRISETIQDRREEFSELITFESGKPIQFSRAEVSRAVSTFAIAAEEANRIGGEVVPLDIVASGEGFAGVALRFPLGPVAAITPFNFPLNLVAHKVAPALAAGNSVVLKPAPQAPLTSLLLAQVVLAAGAPPGYLNVVMADPSHAETLVRDERIRLVSFTGSARVGWHLKDIAGKKKVVLELGGNAAAVIHEDADLDWAVKRCVIGSFANAGQVCIKVQRLLVHRPIHKPFIERFIAATRAVKVGDPMDPETVAGPLIDEISAARVESWIAEARSTGAKILTGGQRQGTVMEPTVIEGAADGLKVSCEEVFGPVTIVEPYDDFETALDRVNASRYGLQAGVFTYDIRRINAAVQKLNVGGVIINDSPMFRVDNFPYGGVKDSGFGREGVRHAIEDMTELKMVALNLQK